MSEWVERKRHRGRVVVGVSEHKTSAMQIAAVALTDEEEAVSHLSAMYMLHHIKQPMVIKSCC